MSLPGELDVLESRPRRTLAPGSRRRLLAGLVAVLVVAVLLDAGVRRTEAAAVQRCAARAGEVVARVDLEVDAMTNYVGRAMLTVHPGVVSEVLYRRIEARAREVLPPVRDALVGCRDGRVLPWHHALARQRSACEQLTARAVERLEQVSRNGRAVYGSGAPGDGLAASCAGGG